ncbi:MAG: GNAT family N-acetyltransferase [Clostridia bacterium]
MVELKIVKVEDIYEIRYKVLRPEALDISAAMFDGDLEATSIHFEAFVDGVAAGCLSIIRKSNPAFTEKIQYQMRGLAVYAQFRNQGIAKALIKLVEFHAFVNRKADRIWLNGRTSVMELYDKMNYEKTGEPFMIRNVCEHVLLSKKLENYKTCCCEVEIKKD